jgi:hypothetical protein
MLAMLLPVTTSCGIRKASYRVKRTLRLRPPEAVLEVKPMLELVCMIMRSHTAKLTEVCSGRLRLFNIRLDRASHLLPALVLYSSISNVFLSRVRRLNFFGGFLKTILSRTQVNRGCIPSALLDGSSNQRRK